MTRACISSTISYYITSRMKWFITVVCRVSITIRSFRLNDEFSNYSVTTAYNEFIMTRRVNASWDLLLTLHNMYWRCMEIAVARYEFIFIIKFKEMCYHLAKEAKSSIWRPIIGFSYLDIKVSSKSNLTIFAELIRITEIFF